jgi:hypothetical protein
MALERSAVRDATRTSVGAPPVGSRSGHPVLGLQAAAGNRAVTGILAPANIQRCRTERPGACACEAADHAGVQRADLSGFGLDDVSFDQPAQQGGDAGPSAPTGGRVLTSPRFAGDGRLEACLNDRARLGQGDVSQSTARVQQALIDLGHDLGPTGAQDGAGPGVHAVR